MSHWSYNLGRFVKRSPNKGIYKFIKANQKLIDEQILEGIYGDPPPITDRDRKQWVLNDWTLTMMWEAWRNQETEDRIYELRKRKKTRRVNQLGKRARRKKAK